MTSRSEELLARATSYLIPHKANLLRLPILASAKGAICLDVEGNEYIDFLSGQVCSTIGHSHPAVVEAIKIACDKMLHSNCNIQNEDSILLAEELATILPKGISKTLFKSTGGEANEIAIHMAKMISGGWEVVSLNTGYHGATAATRANTFQKGLRHGYGPGMPGAFAFPVPDSYRSTYSTRKQTANGWECEQSAAEALAIGTELFDAQSDGGAAAVLVEPILSNGGIIEPPKSFLLGLKRFAEERGMLFIMDECQTGLGRAGTMLVSNDYGFTPDIITLSKSLGAGLPVGSASTTPEIVETLNERRFWHSSSHVNEPLAGLVGLAVLKALKEENLIAQGLESGEFIKAELRNLAKKWDLIGDVRGRGMLIGMELVLDRDSKAPAMKETQRFYDACMSRGLIMNVCGKYMNVIRMMPPLTTSRQQITKALTIMDDAFAEVKGVKARSKSAAMALA